MFNHSGSTGIGSPIGGDTCGRGESPARRLCRQYPVRRGAVILLICAGSVIVACFGCRDTRIAIISSVVTACNLLCYMLEKTIKQSVRHYVHFSTSYLDLEVQARLDAWEWQLVPSSYCEVCGDFDEMKRSCGFSVGVKAVTRTSVRMEEM
jgi:hypothetical protein